MFYWEMYFWKLIFFGDLIFSGDLIFLGDTIFFGDTIFLGVLGFNLYFQAQSYRDNSDSLSIVAPEIEGTQDIRVIMGSRDR